MRSLLSAMLAACTLLPGLSAQDPTVASKRESELTAMAIATAIASSIASLIATVNSTALGTLPSPSTDPYGMPQFETFDVLAYPDVRDAMKVCVCVCVCASVCVLVCV